MTSPLDVGPSTANRQDRIKFPVLTHLLLLVNPEISFWTFPIRNVPDFKATRKRRFEKDLLISFESRRISRLNVLRAMIAT